MGKMYPKDTVARAREVDLLSYLRINDPYELVKVSGETYSTREHDSLIINNGKWYWFSRGFGGYNALDYLVKVKDYGFKDAVEMILGQGIPCPPYRPKERENKKLLLPKRNKDNEIVIGYLEGRGIKRSLIDWCIKHGFVYESCGYHNVIFVGFDEKRGPRYGAFRTTGNVRMLGDASGSDKKYSFRIDNGDKEKLHIFEAPIDLLSYMSLISEERCASENYLSLAGIYGRKADGSKGKLPVAISHFLETHNETKHIYLHLDNDGPGRSAASSLAEHLREKHDVIFSPPPYGKDYNEYLQIVLKQDGERSKDE